MHSSFSWYIPKESSFFFLLLGSYRGWCYVSWHLWRGIMTMQISGFLESTDWSDPDAVILIQFSRVNSCLSSLLQIILSCIDWIVFLSSGVCLAWGWSERSREIWGSHSSNGKAQKVAQSTAVSKACPCPPSCPSYKLESKGEEEYRGSWPCYHGILLATAWAVAVAVFCLGWRKIGAVSWGLEVFIFM